MHFHCVLWIVCQLSVSCLSVVCQLSVSCLPAVWRELSATVGRSTILSAQRIAEAGRATLCSRKRNTCAAHDANEGLRALPLLPEIEDAGINNLNLFLDQAKVPKRLRLAIAKDLNALGAVDVNEVSQADWDALPTWPLLITCERLRILALMP